MRLALSGSNVRISDRKLHRMQRLARPENPFYYKNQNLIYPAGDPRACRHSETGMSTGEESGRAYRPESTPRLTKLVGRERCQQRTCFIYPIEHYPAAQSVLQGHSRFLFLFDGHQRLGEMKLDDTRIGKQGIRLA